MARVLYVSYTGILEPLGRSQVIQYLLGLSKAHKITLLSFEKPENLKDKNLVSSIKEQCLENGIDWQHLRYHSQFGIAANLYNLTAGSLKALQLTRTSGATIIHCRSYVPATVGLVVKYVFNIHHIFDMRGFWVDERVDGGIWARDSLKYRVFKYIERRIFLNTDHVVSLTNAGKREIQKFNYLQRKAPPIYVIPTCTNLEVFQPPVKSSPKQEPFTLGYIGSIGSWYLFEDVAKTVKILFDSVPNARFLVLSKSEHDTISQTLMSEKVDLRRVEVRSTTFEETPAQMARMDAGIFFIKPVWSKLATSPTRLGEFLAMGKPCLANTPVGDIEDVLNASETGITIKSTSHESLENGLNPLLRLAQQPDIAERCRKTAQDLFSLEDGVCRYSEIYDLLAPPTSRDS